MIPATNSSIAPSLLITIFVPVFNGEKYLNETLLSIKNQTYSNFEVLLVDDSSTDGSKNILDKFVFEDNRFKVFVKENGGMTCASWNYIIPKIKGNFVFYASQDDIFSIDLIEKMVAKQQETNADFILPDMEYYFENGQNNKKTIGLNGDRNAVLTGSDAFEASINWTIHGFALIKSSLIIAEFFPEDAFDNDDFITRKLYLKSNKIVFCEGTFFYRQDNPEAITRTFSKKNFYSLNSAIRLYNLMEENNFNKNGIIQVQFSLLLRYLQLKSIYYWYKFDGKADKDEINQFLLDFRKQHFTLFFYSSNLIYAIKYIKIRFILIVLVSCNESVVKVITKLYSKILYSKMTKN